MNFMDIVSRRMDIVSIVSRLILFIDGLSTILQYFTLVELCDTMRYSIGFI